MQSNQDASQHAYTAGFHTAKQEYDKGYQAALQQFGPGGQPLQGQNAGQPMNNGQMNRPYDDNNFNQDRFSDSGYNHQLGGNSRLGGVGNHNDPYGNGNNLQGNQDTSMHPGTNNYGADANTQSTLADQALREAEIHDVPPVGTGNKIKSKIPGHYRDGTKIPREFREQY